MLPKCQARLIFLQGHFARRKQNEVGTDEHNVRVCICKFCCQVISSI